MGSEEGAVRKIKKVEREKVKRKEKIQMSLFPRVCKVLSTFSVIFDTIRRLNNGKKAYRDDR